MVGRVLAQQQRVLLLFRRRVEFYLERREALIELIVQQFFRGRLRFAAVLVGTVPVAHLGVHHGQFVIGDAQLLQRIGLLEHRRRLLERGQRLGPTLKLPQCRTARQ